MKELQKELYDFILADGGATPDEISKLFGLMPQETSNQLVLLRHWELGKWRKMGDEIYMVPFDS